MKRQSELTNPVKFTQAIILRQLDQWLYNRRIRHTRQTETRDWTWSLLCMPSRSPDVVLWRWNSHGYRLFGHAIAAFAIKHLIYRRQRIIGDGFSPFALIPANIISSLLLCRRFWPAENLPCTVQMVGYIGNGPSTALVGLPVKCQHI